MEHYDDIRERDDAERATKARRQALRDATHRLQDALGIERSKAPKLADLLRAKAIAFAKSQELTAAVRMGDTVFDALLMFGEVSVAGPDDR